jgi:hypothetical protein
MAMPVPMVTTESTRSGWSAAMRAATTPPMEWPTSLLGPEHGAVAPAVGAFTEAVTVVVDGDDAVALREKLAGAFLPVGEAAAASVEEEQRRAFTVVGVVDAAGSGLQEGARGAPRLGGRAQPLAGRHPPAGRGEGEEACDRESDEDPHGPLPSRWRTSVILGGREAEARGA